MTYLFDKTFYGWLCCIFEAFERKEFAAVLSTVSHYTENIFENPRTIISDSKKARRVLKGLEEKIGKQRAKEFYTVFLKEDVEVWNACFRLCIKIFRGNLEILDNYGDSDVMLFSDAIRKVSRERHRMKAFIRFKKSTDGLFFATIEPDFNVIPLITSFFRNRYTDQPWIIYDVKRKYGVHWDTHTITEVLLSEGEGNLPENKQAIIDLENDELYFQNLWKQYFNSTNIKARRNIKLHLRHVPKRYWKYLPEKM